jgi:Flp pilus assembly protein TadD
MRRAFLGFALLSVAVLACKARSEPSTTTTQASATAKAKPTSVVMAINLGEEDEEGGCGDVIHAVRAAAKKGVRTREIDTRNKADMEAASKKYRIVVQPTVVLLDDDDKEVRRHEGESKETISALKTDLDTMAKK